MEPDQSTELWRLERAFWLGDADFYERTLAPGALMVLPPPAGILDRAATVDSIRSGPRWQQVSFQQQHEVMPGAGTAVLAYRVQADRGPADTSYSAQCSSTYVRDRDRWRLVLHQQTPAPQPGGSGN